MPSIVIVESVGVAKLSVTRDVKDVDKNEMRGDFSRIATGRMTFGIFSPVPHMNERSRQVGERRERERYFVGAGDQKSASLGPPGGPRSRLRPAKLLTERTAR